jgi:membrane protease YdiL (CAAX protease family)
MDTTPIRIGTLSAAVLGVGVVELLAAIAPPELKADPLMLVGALRLAEILLLSGVAVYLESGLASFGVARKRIASGIIRGLLWSGGFGLVAASAGLAAYLLGRDPLSLFPPAAIDGPARIFLLFAVGGFVGPVAEELFFRGFLYGFFRRWGILPAVLLSTLVFVLVHPSGRPVLTQTVGGIVFAAAYEFEKNLLVPVTIHVLGNLAIFGITLLG